MRLLHSPVRLLLAVSAATFVVLALAVAVFAQPAYRGYLFVTVAPRPFDFKRIEQPELNSFYLVSAADIFAQTIQGWVRTPAFLDAVNLAAPNDPLPWIKARKESPQNVILFYPARSANDDRSAALSTVLDQWIAQYNASSGTVFAASNVTSAVADTAPARSVLLAIAFAAALCVGAGVGLWRHVLR